MSHSFTASRGTTFNFNSDLSGVVRVVGSDCEFFVSGKDLLEFAAEYIRRRRIAEAEAATVEQLLGLPGSMLPLLPDGQQPS